MRINPDLEKVLKDKLEEIEVDTAILYLISIKMELKVNCFSEELIRKVNLLKIISRDYNNNKLLWLIPLYAAEEVSNLDDNWKWINEYRSIFEKIGKEYKGDEKGVLQKLKKYFSEHPEVRKEDVLEAALLYTYPFANKQNNPKFMTNANYFINKKVDGVYQSKLSQYLEILKENKRLSNGKNSRFSVIQ